MKIFGYNIFNLNFIGQYILFLMFMMYSVLKELKGNTL